MRTLPRIDYGNVTGLLDKFVGLGKEVVGTLYDGERLIEQGQAQQGKGTEKLQAIRKQAEAKAHREKARDLADKQDQASRAS
jgi:uncharacterized protein YjbJ (UPF0337 family)